MHLFFQIVIDWSPCTCYSVHTETRKNVQLHCLISTDILSTWHFTEMDNHRKDPLGKMKVQQRNKILTLEVKFEWKVNRIIDDIIEYRNAAAAAIWETLYLQPEELSENEIISKRRKVVVTRRIKMSRRKWCQKYSY